MNRAKYLFAWIAVSFIIPKGVMAQAEREFPYFNLGAGAGYFQPRGAWTAHPYAKDVELFRGSVNFNGDLELAFSRVGIALGAGYARLSLKEWEQYIRAQGGNIEASAALMHFGVLLRPYIKTSRPNVVKLELGVFYFLPRSEERFAGKSFDYDFLKSGFGFMAGLGYDRYLSRRTVLTFRIGGTFAPSGVEYVDGKKHSLNGLPVTAGIRFDLSREARVKSPEVASAVSVPDSNLRKFGELAVDGPEELSGGVVRDSTISVLIIISEVPNLKIESNARIVKSNQSGDSDWKLHLTPGRQILTIRAKDHLPVKTEVWNFNAKRAYSMKIIQVKPIPGTLIIETRPDSAGLLINGLAINRKTPYRNDEMAPETYVVEVIREGYDQEYKVLKVESNKITRWSFELKRKRR